MVLHVWGDSIILLVFFLKRAKDKIQQLSQGVFLIYTAAKIFTIILHNGYVQRNVKKAGFNPGTGTINQIFFLIQIIEHSAKHQKPTVSLFIDFTTAFDTVLRNGIWKAMTEDIVPDKTVRLIQACAQRTRA